jgi:hypothetical protein
VVLVSQQHQLTLKTAWITLPVFTYNCGVLVYITDVAPVLVSNAHLLLCEIFLQCIDDEVCNALELLLARLMLSP